MRLQTAQSTVQARPSQTGPGSHRDKTQHHACHQHRLAPAARDDQFFDFSLDQLAADQVAELVRRGIKQTGKVAQKADRGDHDAVVGLLGQDLAIEQRELFAGI